MKQPHSTQASVERREPYRNDFEAVRHEVAAVPDRAVILSTSMCARSRRRVDAGDGYACSDEFAATVLRQLLENV